ncbi:hypothetical protein B0H67DRAFT_548862 [Lasiosphaeris hirsuta]|uniref:Uncharacterized protein n=1 Tax=Lasiosphaeris hirsuta TaxID=260670 RepID=A0AA40EAF1_9PEZI|nr:hypothetical protein B0H67DRAFT_548862 [Lasiosphaeris hirsuta]
MPFFPSPGLVCPVQDTTPRRQNEIDQDVEGRGIVPVVAGIIVTNIYDLVKGILDDNAEREIEFVKSAVADLRAEYSDWNVLIYHNQKSSYSLYNMAYYHYELDLGIDTKGYEIFIFEKGTFHLVGDGGYQNWGFGGCWDKSGSHVDFYTLSTCFE